MKKIYSDSELMRGLKSNKEPGFRYLFDYYYHPVKNNIKQFVTDSNSIEDIVQEVFIALWEKRNTFQDDLKIEGWLFSVSYYKSVSFLRKKIKSHIIELKQTEENGMSDMNDILLNEELAYTSKWHLLKEGIRNLSPQKKKAFILYKLKGKSSEEITREMNMSELSVKQYIKMAMAFLRSYTKLHVIEIIIMCIFYWK